MGRRKENVKAIQSDISEREEEGDSKPREQAGWDLCKALTR